jgi:hypothetical protein
MKARFGLYIFVFVVLAVCIVLVLWHQSVQHKSGTQSENQPVQSASPTLKTNFENQGIQPSSLNAASAVPVPLNAIQSNSQSRVEMYKQALAQKNVPIDFYGQVIDQDSNALAGVKINVTIRHWELTETGMSKMIRLEKQTDNDGRFQINGETGDGFDVEGIQKNGYEVEPGQNGFGAVAGSFENPVVFKMWNTNVHEQLITGEKKFQIVPDGRPYFINITDGTIAESGAGDLKVWIQYTNQVVHGQLYDWSAEIDVVNGGLCLSDNYAMFSAPNDGYVPTFQLQQQIKGGQSGEIGERRFYLKLKEGQEYGKMTINLYAPFNDKIPGLIRLSYAVNPSGSRILR